jgi:hypothetical protein
MDARDDEMQWLRLSVEYLQQQVTSLSHQVQERDREIRKLQEQNRVLRERLAEQQPPEPPASPLPPFVKPSVAQRRSKKPGRKQGHEPALRPPPPKVDRTVDVPLPKRCAGAGRPVCPHCTSPLKKLKRHRRLVEDLVPAKVIVTCYRTHSGYCRHCRRRVESRAPEQPPAANVPHGQVGLNALATAAVLRLDNRLPFGQVSRLLADLPGLRLCAGALAKQIQRLGRWLSGEWERLKLGIRGSSSANADETSWRTAGANQWLWTLCNQRHTLYHVDKSRGGRVIRQLLGRHYGGTLISDFYSAYNTIDCKQQKCLAHLLTDLKQTQERSPPFANGVFCRRCRRLTRDLLKHKRRRDTLDAQVYARRGARLEQRLADLASAHLRSGDADVRRLAERLTRHREQLTAFLWDPAVDGTNNAAERALRPIVVARKISGGSRSEAGARSTAIVASVLHTARRQGRDVLETLKQLLMNCWAGKEPGLLA